MPHIQGTPRDEVLHFPPAFDDYISQDNPVRCIDLFVDLLDLEGLGFKRAVASALGRLAYHPADLLKLYIYGYLNRVRSSRLLEREAQRNIELIWLLKKLTPDHKTIADFRKDNLQPIQQMCRAWTMLCKECGLLGGELVAIDGSKFRAVNNRKRNFSDEKLIKALAHLEQQLAAYLQELDAADHQQTEQASLSIAELEKRIAELQARKQHYEELRTALAVSKKRQISLTDPDSRSMPLVQGVDVCHNVQLAVDAKHHLIVSEALTSDVTDHQQLAPLAKQAKEALGVEALSVVADKGYYHGEQVQACDAAEIVAYVSKPYTSTILAVLTTFRPLVGEKGWRGYEQPEADAISRQ
jgi:transposase